LKKQTGRGLRTYSPRLLLISDEYK
jgi:hypothetical protein